MENSPCPTHTSVLGFTHKQSWALTDLHLEIVERMFIDVLHLLHEPHGIVSQRGDVRAADLVIGAGI